MITTPTTEPFEARLRKAIQSELEKIVVEEADKAAERVKQRVQEKLAVIAMVIAPKYSIEHCGSKMRIEVQIETPQPK